MLSPVTTGGIQNETNQPLSQQFETWDSPNIPERIHQQLQHDKESVSSHDSHSTLAEEFNQNMGGGVAQPLHQETDQETERINPAAVLKDRKLLSTSTTRSLSSQDGPPNPEPYVETGFGTTAGPLEAQLELVLSRVRKIESCQPTVMAAEHKQLQARVAAFESEKQNWHARRERLFGLRDEDLANLIKIRDLLATEKRQRAAEQQTHAELEKLREEYLTNLLGVRDKLARLTWKVEKNTDGEKSETPPKSGTQSVKEGGDLWQAAKNAALEQRLLELEKANLELKQKLEASNAGSLLQDKAFSRSFDVVANPSRVSAKLQQLRLENESLRKEVAGLEDRNADLEDTMHRLKMAL